MAVPRVLVLMGSGETSPTMTKTHRELIARSGTSSAVLLDTPAGFQENVGIVSTKAVEYFKESVNLNVSVASVRRSENERTDPLRFAQALAAIAAADWVFAGPGSPTFAVRQWLATSIPAMLAAKLTGGGAVIMASAAACTAGRRCVPVYEIYKCGAEPYWLDGIDLLASIGLPGVTVIPHFDNTEGTNHDTRFCYLGESRLLALEALLGADETIVGIDEHTALVLDLDSSLATVTGNGAVTIRKNGTIRVHRTGTSLAITTLFADGGDSVTDAAAPSSAPSSAPSPAPSSAQSSARSLGSAASAESATVEADSASADPLATEVEAARVAFEAAVQSRDAAGATESALKLDAALAEWGRDQTSTPERFAALQGGATLRQTMIVRLGSFATSGLADPRETKAALVDLVLTLRASARAEKRWGDSDTIRDGLAAAGVEVRDTANGVEWLLT